MLRHAVAAAVMRVLGTVDPTSVPWRELSTGPTVQQRCQAGGSTNQVTPTAAMKSASATAHNTRAVTKSR